MLELSETERSALKLLLETVLKSQSLQRLTRAAGLLQERSSEYLDGRIITDLRPIFDKHDANKIGGFVTCYTLRLDYFERVDSDARSVFLAIETSELAALRYVIDQAILKGEALKTFFSHRSLRF